MKIEKVIDNYSGYLFSSDGRVYSLRRGVKKEIVGSKDKDGYLKITLIRDDGKSVYFRKHRLIALAFIGDSELQVNHKDGDILNNHISNLEYVTSMENQGHRRKREGYHVGVCWANKENKWRAYIQYNKKWKHLGFYNDFDSAKKAYSDALSDLGIKNKYI